MLSRTDLLRRRSGAPRERRRAVPRRCAALFAAAVLVAVTACGGGGGGGGRTGRGGPDGPATTRAATTTTTVRVVTPLPVGELNVTLTDRSRPIPPRDGDPGADARALPTLVLYPARSDGPGTPAERRGGPWPLVVFSHGFTGTGPAYTPFLRRIAAAGYVVAAPTFPRTSRGAPGGPYLADYRNQPADVRFVIDELAAATTGRGAGADVGDLSRLRGVVDTERVAVAGHSLGGATTLGVAFHSCCTDRRVRAAVPIAPVRLPFDGGDYRARPLPVLLVHGDQDPILRYQLSADLYEQARPPKYLLTLLGAGHTPFVPPWSDPMVGAITAFLDRYVRGDVVAAARVTGATVEGVSTLRSQAR